MPAPPLLESLKDECTRRLKAYSIFRIGCRWVAMRDIPAYGQVSIRVSDDLLAVIEQIRREALTEPQGPPDIMRART